MGAGKGRQKRINSLTKPMVNSSVIINSSQTKVNDVILLIDKQMEDNYKSNAPDYFKNKLLKSYKTYLLSVPSNSMAAKIEKIINGSYMDNQDEEMLNIINDENFKTTFENKSYPELAKLIDDVEGALVNEGLLNEDNMFFVSPITMDKVPNDLKERGVVGGWNEMDRSTIKIIDDVIDKPYAKKILTHEYLHSLETSFYNGNADLLRVVVDHELKGKASEEQVDELLAIMKNNRVLFKHNYTNDYEKKLVFDKIRSISKLENTPHDHHKINEFMDFANTLYTGDPKDEQVLIVAILPLFIDNHDRGQTRAYFTELRESQAFIREGLVDYITNNHLNNDPFLDDAPVKKYGDNIYLIEKLIGQPMKENGATNKEVSQELKRILSLPDGFMKYLYDEYPTILNDANELMQSSS